MMRLVQLASVAEPEAAAPGCALPEPVHVITPRLATTVTKHAATALALQLLRILLRLALQLLLPLLLWLVLVLTGAVVVVAGLVVVVVV